MAAATLPLRGWRQVHHSIRTASLSAAATMVRDSSPSYKQHQAGTLRLPKSYIMTYRHTTFRPLSTTVVARQGQAPRFKAMIMLKRKDGISREEFAGTFVTDARGSLTVMVGAMIVLSDLVAITVYMHGICGWHSVAGVACMQLFADAASCMISVQMQHHACMQCHALPIQCRCLSLQVCMGSCMHT